jgi:DNA-binding NarL/FixJ family response regulator
VSRRKLTAVRANDILGGTAIGMVVVARDRLIGEVVAAALTDLVDDVDTIEVVDQSTCHALGSVRGQTVIELDGVDAAVVITTDAASASPRTALQAPRVASLEQLARLASHGLAGNVRRTLPHRPVRRISGDGSARLTDRELEVLREMRRGCDNGAVAASLGISMHTVRSHVGNILRKSGTTSRVEAIARLS